jgi:regulator of sirC expression with transglutaminase-like and TPR domain
LNLIEPDHRSWARRRLGEALVTEGALDLVETTLLIAAETYPDLDVNREANRVRLISAEGARRVYDRSNPFARLDGLRVYLFEELGFRGNVDDYNDPRNCYLNEVLDRRLGIPLTLSILFLELATAAGFEARGVGLPGHFVCRVEYGGRSILVDAYSGGQVISEEDCRRLVGRTTGRPSLFRRSLLGGIDERAMLGRLLLNLKHVYVEREEYDLALSVVERLLLVNPGDPTEIRDRGFLQAHLGRAGRAIADLETYLARTPDAPDTESVRGRVAWLRKRLTELN